MAGKEYLNAGHSAGHVEVLPVPAPRLHEGHAVAAAHVLRGVLTRRNVDGRHNVRRVGVEAACTKYKIKRLQCEILGSPFFLLFRMQQIGDIVTYRFLLYPVSGK